MEVDSTLEGREPRLSDMHKIPLLEAVSFISVRDYGSKIFTAHKRSLQRLCFYTCLSVILFTGGGMLRVVCILLECILVGSAVADPEFPRRGGEGRQL